MSHDADDPENPRVCLCFGVTERKLVAYCRREKPSVASQLSECLGAGTGCGWCRPLLERLHAEVAAAGDGPVSLGLDPATHASGRSAYRSAKRSAPD